MNNIVSIFNALLNFLVKKTSDSVVVPPTKNIDTWEQKVNGIFSTLAIKSTPIEIPTDDVKDDR